MQRAFLAPCGVAALIAGANNGAARDEGALLQPTNFTAVVVSTLAGS
jgi:hypothetical protein